MKNRNKTILYAEIGLIIFVWVVLMLTPVLFREDNDKPLWRSIVSQFEILIPLTVLFFINRFFLVPKILFRNKPVTFILSVMGVILILTLGSFVYHVYADKVPSNKTPAAAYNNRPPRNDDREDPGKRPPPKEEQEPDGMRPPPPDRPQPRERFGAAALKPDKRQPRPVPPYANVLILSILVVGFDTGLRSGLRWMEAENEKVRLEKENVSHQLALLKTQVSPHFFMNTLNNIHALVDSNTEEAKEAIIKLSRMMRYLLYETETEKTTLKKEVEFLESYINLMRLRFSEKVRIILNLPSVIPDAAIPPFLFTSFIENAFKHGVSYKNESFISIDLIPGNERLIFITTNSKADNIRMDEFSGIGIENSRKRLELLYGDRYHLDIIENEEVFTVNLSIPL